MARGGNSADHGLTPLDDAACWDLLSRARVGRLAWTDPDGRIMVVPVNFGIDGHTVVLRTGDTVLLAAARACRRCAFQADELEPGLRSGWTVLVDGHLSVVEDRAAVERLGQLVDPWLREPRPHVLLLTKAHITGRRLRQQAGSVDVVPIDADEHP